MYAIISEVIWSLVFAVIMINIGLRMENIVRNLGRSKVRHLRNIKFRRGTNIIREYNNNSLLATACHVIGIMGAGGVVLTIIIKQAAIPWLILLPFTTLAICLNYAEKRRRIRFQQIELIPA